MQQENRVYIAIDLKSFYASVECRERRLDPLTTNLVVADESRTEKTICLSVSPGHEGLRGSRAAPAVRGGAKSPGGQRQTADRGSRTRSHRLFLGFE